MAKRDFSHADNPEFTCHHDVVLLPFGRRSYLPAIVERFAGEEVVLDETTDRIAYQLRRDVGDCTLMYSGMGSPAAANALEMAAANGARRVVIFGACGGVDPRVGIGDLLVVGAAVRGEGTSRYYAPPEFPAAFDLELSSAILNRAREVGHHPVHHGFVYTTDAGYRQGPEVYEHHKGLILGVESECAAAAVVGARLGLRMAALLFCSDNVTLSKTDDQKYRGLRDPRVRAGFDAGLDIVAGVVLDQGDSFECQGLSSKC